MNVVPRGVATIRRDRWRRNNDHSAEVIRRASLIIVLWIPIWKNKKNISATSRKIEPKNDSPHSFYKRPSARSVSDSSGIFPIRRNLAEKSCFSRPRRGQILFHRPGKRIDARRFSSNSLEFDRMSREKRIVCIRLANITNTFVKRVSPCQHEKEDRFFFLHCTRGINRRRFETNH